MKRLLHFLWCFVLSLTCIAVLNACDNKKTQKYNDFDEDEELVEDEFDEDDEDDEDIDTREDVDDEEEDVDEDEDFDEDDMMTPEELEAYENEVWKSLGGTYAFSDGETYCAVDVSLDDDTKCKIYMGSDVNLHGTIDPETGFITGVDDDGKVAFKGAVYAGGNLLKGTLYGKPVRFNGMGGL